MIGRENVSFLFGYDKAAITQNHWATESCEPPRRHRRRPKGVQGCGLSADRDTFIFHDVSQTPVHGKLYCSTPVQCDFNNGVSERSNYRLIHLPLYSLHLMWYKTCELQTPSADMTCGVKPAAVISCKPVCFVLIWRVTNAVQSRSQGRSLDLAVRLVWLRSWGSIQLGFGL